MIYQSFNPATLKLMKSYESINDLLLNQKLVYANKAYNLWSKLELKQRLQYVDEIGKTLKKNVLKYAQLITNEMGKPISQSKAEIEKSALLCQYYVENAETLLSNYICSSNAKESYLSYEPIGVIFGVMPWNFPYWQVFRFFIPNIVLGNTTLLKHASNVPQCAEAIESIVLESGCPEGVFQNLFIDYEQSDKVIQSPFVWGVTLTGSEKAGSRVAEVAGKNIKKSVLELGGSDPFIVLEDANIDEAVDSGIIARMQNAGQSCIAAKRFIILEKVYDEFIKKFSEASAKLVLGDPMNEETYMGPITRESLLLELEDQVNVSVKMGAKVVTGGKRSSAGKLFYEPTVLTDIKEGMPAFNEEIFGPVACVFKVKTIEEAIELANNTEFGLGAAVWTQNIKLAKEIASKLQTGTVAINGGVRSEPRLPFGGTKKSGYGRELADYGLREFSNIKTVNIF